MLTALISNWLVLSAPPPVAPHKFIYDVFELLVKDIVGPTASFFLRCNIVPGAFVPIPTLPSDFTRTCSLPSTSKVKKESAVSLLESACNFNAQPDASI